MSSEISTEQSNKPKLVAHACETCKHSGQPLTASRHCARCISYSNKPGYKAAKKTKGGKGQADTGTPVIDAYNKCKGDMAELVIWLDTLRVDGLKMLAGHLGVRKVSNMGKYDLINEIMEKGEE